MHETLENLLMLKIKHLSFELMTFKQPPCVRSSSVHLKGTVLE